MSEFRDSVNEGDAKKGDCTFCSMVSRGQAETIKKREAFIPGAHVQGDILLDAATYRRALIGTVVLHHHLTVSFRQNMCGGCKLAWSLIESQWLEGVNPC